MSQRAGWLAVGGGAGSSAAEDTGWLLAGLLQGGTCWRHSDFGGFPWVHPIDWVSEWSGEDVGFFGGNRI